MLSFSTKLVFSLPFLMYDRSTKAKRNQVRDERKKNVQEKRIARRRLRKAQKTVLASVKMNLMAAASKSKLAEADGAPEATAGEQKSDNADKVDQTKKPESVADAGDVELKSLDQDKSPETIETTLINEDAEIPVFSSFDHQIVAGDNKAMSVVFGSFVLSLTYAASGTRIPLDYCKFFCWCFVLDNVVVNQLLVVSNGRSRRWALSLTKLIFHAFFFFFKQRTIHWNH